MIDLIWRRERDGLIESHIPGLRRFARALTHGDRDRADDLVQECLMQALAGYGALRARAKIRSWLFTILHNAFLAERRRAAGRGAPVPIEEADGLLPGVAPAQEHTLAAQDLARALTQLSQEQRTVLLLVAVENLSYAETAQVVGAPVGTVMSRLSRARERLRDIIDGGGAQTSKLVAFRRLKP